MSYHMVELFSWQSWGVACIVDQGPGRKVELQVACKRVVDIGYEQVGTHTIEVVCLEIW